MSSLSVTNLKQRDKILKKYLIISSNYKNRYIKKKQYEIKTNCSRIPKSIAQNKKRERDILMHKSSSVETKKTNKYNIENLLENNFDKKTEKINTQTINGGINEQKYSYYDYTNNGKYNNDIINYNLYSKDIHINNNKDKYANLKNEKFLIKINLKKYINSKPKDKKGEVDYLNKKYYLSEKKMMKINLIELKNNLKYLKLNKASSFEKPKKSKNIELNYIKSPTINFIIENINPKLKTIQYNSKTFNYSALTKETREQFSMEKNRMKKFTELKKEDNILLNYFPEIKNKTDNFTINSNHIEYNIINEKDNNKSIESKNKEIIIINPDHLPSKSDDNINNLNDDITLDKNQNEDKNIDEVKKINNNSKQFMKFKEKLKKNLESEDNKKNNKYKISVKIKRLAVGLENNMKKNETEDLKEQTEEKREENEIGLHEEKIKENVPIIYKKKKRTKIIFTDK
jgi:hypothetical protein